MNIIKNKLKIDGFWRPKPVPKASPTRPQSITTQHHRTTGPSHHKPSTQASKHECVLFVLGPVQHIAFSYGNLEMSNISAAAILVTGILSIVFFVIASLKTDTKGLIESSIEHPDKNK